MLGVRCGRDYTEHLAVLRCYRVRGNAPRARAGLAQPPTGHTVCDGCQPARATTNASPTVQFTIKNPQNPPMQVGFGSSGFSALQQSESFVHFSLILAHIGFSQLQLPVSAPAAELQ